MRKTKSVEWTCELEGCNNKFKRYPSQIKKSIKRFCSQECSAYGTYDNRIATLKIKNSKNQWKHCSNCNDKFSGIRELCVKCRSHEKQCNLLGITISDYKLLLEKQNGSCAICDLECSTGRRLAIDHDHKTGKVRGLLCYSCNIKLGWYQKKEQRIQRYLKPL